MDTSVSQKVSVLIFGGVGRGKSSLCNVLADKEVAVAGNDATGVTFQSSSFKVVNEGVCYRFIDTAGLNEGSQGSVPAKESLIYLKKLLQRKYNLAIMVHMGRLSEASFAGNYGVFVEAFLRRAGIPVILVQNGVLETGEEEWFRSSSCWIKKNCPYFMDVIPACSLSSQTLDR